MNFRVGACALLVCLAGCSAEAPDARLGTQTGKAATQLSGQKLRAVQMDREAAESIANAPDHGKLIEYKNKGTASKREGAYTWYPIAISEAHALKAVVTGEMTIPSPDGSQVKLKYERHEEQADGNWTWIGRVVGGDQNQEAILTFGEKAVYGSIPQSSGAPLSLQTRSGALYAVQTDLSKVKNPNTAATDMMVPPAMALRQTLMASASKAQVSQAADVSTKASTPSTTVDVAIGYTQGFASMPGGQSAAVTRLVFLVAVGNEAYQNSLITGALRLVHAVQVNYADNTTNQSALEDLTGVRNGAQIPVATGLAPLRAAREEYGADVAVLVRKFQTPENDGCGIAWLNGAGQTEINPAVDDDYAFAVVSDGEDTGTDGNNYFCAPETLVHELGHVMGSAHDQENSKTSTGALLYGRYPYSFGLKTTTANGNFYTIMAYGANNQNFYRTFSNPLVLKCGPTGGTLPCGIANQADNARSLNQTLSVVASFRTAIVPFVGLVKNDVSGDGRSDLQWYLPSAGILNVWAMSGVSLVGNFGYTVSTTCTPRGYGDFNGDAKSDVVFTCAADRSIYILFSTGTGFIQQFVGNYAAGWAIINSSDVDGDGKGDILWHNASTGQLNVWLMNGPYLAGNFAKAISTACTAKGFGDVNGDGRADITWTCAGDNSIYMWISSGNGYTQQPVGAYAAGWSLVNSSDANGDGKSDLLWYQQSSGLFNVWIMNGTALTANFSKAISASCTPKSFGDFNADGRYDVAWTCGGDNSIYMWTSTGGGYNQQFVGNYGSGWVLAN